MSKKAKFNIADLRGLTSIIKDATLNITDLAEDLNKRIVHPEFLPSTPIQDLITNVAGVAYNGVRFGTKIIGGGLEKAMNLFNQQIGLEVSSEKKIHLIGILNGVVGDYLEENNNPLAIQMQFKYKGEKIALDKESINNAYDKINGKILLMVHGSCANDWKWNQGEHHHGAALSEALDSTPIYLFYNSGQHISTNGKELNHLLEELMNNWPVRVEEISILTHSMGGLVGRSAIHYGTAEKSTWIQSLKNIVFLGTPHHGAPLEQIGNYVDQIFEKISFMKPFARLGKMRSAGVTDLRYGNLLEEDWEGQDRFEKNEDRRKPVPLPKKVNSYAVAACLGKESAIKNKLVGDGLVLKKSALGQHKDSTKKLAFKKANTHTIYESSHNDLLSNLEVSEKMKSWLK